MDKRHTRKVWLILLLVIVAVFWLSGVAQAQEAAPAPRGIDVIVLLDDSGSMATCWPWVGPVRTENCFDSQNPPSDPNDLRYSAARLLVMLTDQGDRIAVVRFNAITQDIIGTLELTNSPSKRLALTDSIRALDGIDAYEAYGGYTRIDLGLQRAATILTAGRKPDRPGYVILLTDGVPTQPGDQPRQDAAIQESVNKLADMGAQVFPVLLCNQKAGCPNDAFVRRNMSRVPAKAKTADELLTVFSDLFAQMKPPLHMIDQRNDRSQIEFTTRPAHGARQLVIVAENNGLIALRRDGNPQTVSSAYGDDNVLLNVVDADKLGAGTWTVETRGTSSFVVAQTETYPDLLYPPSSVPGSVVAPFYVPSGKPIAILAQVVGPGVGEPVLVDGITPMTPLAPGSPLLWTVLPGGTSRLLLQVGEDTKPLQIRREFNLETRGDLPLALALSPVGSSACLPDDSCLLQAGFGPGPDVSETQGTVYVIDDSEDGALVYSAPLTCAGRECSNSAAGFERIDGHTYTIRFFLQGQSQGVLFGDWAETTLMMEPAVYLRGLPPTLNLKMQPEDGWPVTINVGTLEDLGRLGASISLIRTEDNSPVADTQVSLDVDVSQPGEQEAHLQVELPATLRPGSYEGEINFQVSNASEDNPIRLPDAIPVTLNLARPQAEILTTTADFGSITFDTSPSFRVDQTTNVDIRFNDIPFSLVPEIQETSCPGLEMAAGEPLAQSGSYRVPIYIRSDGPISPRSCSGTFSLTGPSADYDVLPTEPLAWRFVIPGVDWEILGVENGEKRTNEAVLGRLGRVGERNEAMLLVRYTGRAPFSLALTDLQGQADVGGMTIGQEDMVLLSSPVIPYEDEPNVYQVPVALVVQRPLPYPNQAAQWLLGTGYSGRLRLQVAGLPGGVSHEIGFRLHNPGWYQRYIQPFYTWWWPGAITCPLSLLIPLVVLALVTIRRKDADVARMMSAQQPALEGLDEIPTYAAPRTSAAPRISTTPSQSASGSTGARTRDVAGPTPDEGQNYNLPQRHRHTRRPQASDGIPTSRRRGTIPDSRSRSGTPPRRSSTRSSRRSHGTFRE